MCLRQWPGTVSSLLSVYLNLSRGTSRNWSVLAFRFASLPSPPMPATAQALTLAVIWLGQFGHLTGDTQLTKISLADK